MADRRVASRLIPFIGLVAALAVVAACTIPGTVSAPKIHAENVWSRPAASMSGLANPTAEGETQPVDAEEGKPATQKPAEGQAMKPAGGNGAIFMTLVNEGGTPDRVLMAQCDAADTVELHESHIEDDVMKMQPVVGGIEVPANGKLELKPGGFHVMLIGLKRDLAVGDKVPVTIKLERSGELKLEAEVKQP